MEESLAIIDSLIKQVDEMEPLDKVDSANIKTRIKICIKKYFNKDEIFTEELEMIRLVPIEFGVLGTPGSKSDQYSVWNNGKKKLINLLNNMKFDIVSFSRTDAQISENFSKTLGKKIFIVHGHNNEMKEAVARLLENKKFEPIIFHEQANKGRTIIEKLIQEGNTVSFAIILLSGDDIFQTTEGKKVVRTRQNVILELGYFLGILGKERVFVLYSTDNDFEMPSDFHGVLYTEYDKYGAWKTELCKELIAIGHYIQL